MISIRPPYFRVFRHHPGRLTSVVAGLFLAGLLVAAPARAQTPPTFDKTFAPDSVGLGNLSALTFEITAVDAVTDLAFSDDLPAGLTFADPASLTLGGDCDAATAVTLEDADTLSFESPRLGAGTTCTVRVDVRGEVSGVYVNTSSDLTSSAGSSGSATDTLTVALTTLRVSKSFDPASVAPGAGSRLVIELSNPAATAVSEIAFTDMLPVGLVVAASPNVVDTCGGTLSAPAETGFVSPGADSLSYAGGSLPEGSSCSIAIDVETGGAGTFVNRTENVLVGAGETPVGFAAALLSATLEPVNLSKEFADPVVPGDTTTLTFTLTNSTRDTVTDIAFTDDLEATLSGLQVTGPVPLIPCGTGSSVSGTSLITFSGGNLASGASCFVTLDVEIPEGAATGTYPNTTSSVSSSAGTFSPASDDLDVGYTPAILKQFCATGAAVSDACTPVSQVSGGDVILARFTVFNPDPDNPLTGVTFQDDFGAFLPGVEVSPDSQADVCGAGSTFADIDGTDPNQVFRLSDGTLAPETLCVFQVELQLPISVPPGEYVNRTTPVQGFYGATPVGGAVGEARVTRGLAPILSKEFNDPVIPGANVELVFTLDASESDSSFFDISFSDDFEATLTGLTTASSPLVACGGSLSSSGSGISLSGANVDAGDTCSFSVDLSVPADAAPGSYLNTTSVVSAFSGDETRVTGDPASDELDVVVAAFGKEFTDDPVGAGDTVSLEFTLINLTTDPMTGLTFTDDLEAVLPGLAPTDLPQAGVCGVGSQLSFAAGVLSLTGGSLAAGTDCTFSTVLQVPMTAGDGVYGNVTSQLQGSLDGTPFAAAPASDVLVVTVPLSLAKVFAGDVLPGGTVELVFTLTTGSDLDLTDIGFSDDLGAVLAGLVAVDLPADGFCGAGSQITGTTVLTVSGASVPSGSSCDFSVLVAVPDDAAAGVYTNVTSPVTALADATEPVDGPPAMAPLTVLADPAAADIPALDLLGLLALMGLLGIFGVSRLRS